MMHPKCTLYLAPVLIRDLAQRLPKARQEKPIWQKAAAMLMQAHASGKSADIAAATNERRFLEWEIPGQLRRVRVQFRPRAPCRGSFLAAARGARGAKRRLRLRPVASP